MNEAASKPPRSSSTVDEPRRDGTPFPRRRVCYDAKIRRETMSVAPEEDLLETVGIRHPCDLDLLVFFSRHPRVLLTSEQLAARVGYDLKQVARSLDFLIERGLLSRWLNHTRVARVYLFRTGGVEDGVEHLLRIGSTPEGRSVLIRRLREGASRAAAVPDPGHRAGAADPGM